ncbi:hypothetical protein EVAR_86985_1 [Eumeta japonica]|uniref:Uncharacterized protein n=1 Tax=Eumeta variegata TaxID=151549 RepID=A0A4C1W879_EUMVA|nr:hypothetical protein EVAR_86985_1 [Eumeta japonica]
MPRSDDHAREPRPRPGVPPSLATAEPEKRPEDAIRSCAPSDSAHLVVLVSREQPPERGPSAPRASALVHLGRWSQSYRESDTGAVSSRSRVTVGADCVTRPRPPGAPPSLASFQSRRRCIRRAESRRAAALKFVTAGGGAISCKRRGAGGSHCAFFPNTTTEVHDRRRPLMLAAPLHSYTPVWVLIAQGANPPTILLQIEGLRIV